MSCRHPQTEHKFPKLPDVRALYANGIREIFSCNCCLAVKIVFHVEEGHGERQGDSTVVIEPPDPV